MGHRAGGTAVVFAGLALTAAMFATVFTYWPRPFVDHMSGWSWGDSALHAMYATLIVIGSGYTAMLVIGISIVVSGKPPQDPWKSGSRVGDICFYPAMGYSFWIAWQGYDGVNSVFVVALALGLLNSSKLIRKRVFKALCDYTENHGGEHKTDGPRSLMMAQPSNKDEDNDVNERAE